MLLSLTLFIFRLALYSSAFERINVLFNVAALYSQIARIQNFESDEGLKAACKQFQVKDIIKNN